MYLCLWVCAHDIAVLITQWCGPTQLVLTFEDEGPGKFSQREIDKMAVRDKKGNVISLNLPKRAVVISNHQVCSHTQQNSALVSDENDRSMPTGGMHGGECSAFDMRISFDRLAQSVFLHEHILRHLHCPETQSEMGPDCWLGMLFSPNALCPYP
jgi:hypothetical protein